MLPQLAPAFRLTVLLTIVTGLLYPGIVTGICQLLFKQQANGSLITRNDRVIGSHLIGQNFSKPEYFHPRPSAAGSDGYDAANSSGSNLGPTNQKLLDRIGTAAAQFHRENPAYTGPIPADALTTSASGLDPDISLANAAAQIPRVAGARHADRPAIEQLVSALRKNRDLGFLGEPRVNVLDLNLELDQRFPPK